MCIRKVRCTAKVSRSHGISLIFCVKRYTVYHTEKDRCVDVLVLPVRMVAISSSVSVVGGGFKPMPNASDGGLSTGVLKTESQL